MKLLFKGEEVGEVHSVDYDFPWWYARFVPAHSFEDQFRSVFNRLTKDEPDDDCWEGVNPELVDEENWHLQEEDGELRSISLPAIHSDNVIAWRRR